MQDGTIGAEPFWISVYREGSPSVHGKVLVKASLEHEDQVDLEPQGDIDFERQTSVSQTCRDKVAREEARATDQS